MVPLFGVFKGVWCDFGKAKEKLKSLISKIYKGVWCQTVKVWGFLVEVISMIEATLKLLIIRLFDFCGYFQGKDDIF